MITIIIPVYNAEKYIRETIQSVKNQISTNWKCIVIDDGSTDNTKSIIDSEIKNDDRFQYFHQENKGPGAARNFGVSKCNTDLITFLDADDLIGDVYLQNAEIFMDENPKIPMYYGKVLHLQEDGNQHITKPFWNYYPFILEYNQFNTTAVLRKQRYLDVHGYNEDLKNREDWEFYVRYLYKGSVYVSDDIAFTYRHHKGSRHIATREAEQKYKRLIMELNKDIYKKYDRYISPINREGSSEI